MSNFSLVITSIASPQNKILQQIAHQAKKHQVEVILIGDRKSPNDFYLEGINFYSIQHQRQLDFKLAKNLPENHYSRKNIGYLVAISKSYDVIVETDDDNIPYPQFWQERNLQIEAEIVENQGWVNIYKYFTGTNIWPRGLPLEFVKQPVENGEIKEIEAPIQQGLANENPDVDAIYRFVGYLPIEFKKRLPIALGRSSFSPFNSQNTTWHKKAFPLLYLPSYCSFRMTDIWRSFVAQRITQEYNWLISFHSSTVYQERNEHNILKDFEQEIPGYLNNANIMDSLLETELCSDEEGIFENLMRSYKTLIKNGWIGNEELFLLENWIEDLMKLGL